MAAPALLLSMGTRPEIIKMAPVYLELKRRGANVSLLHTGQHADIAAPFYVLFGITPDFSIPLNRANGDMHCELSELGSQLLSSIGSILKQANPDVVLVHGDTSSALMAALAAFYQLRKVAHVEAGLRSHNRYEPFPEEMNRTLIARMSHWHFAPTRTARDNLLAEGIAKKSIHVVGNTIVDAVQAIMPEAAAEPVEALKPLLEGRRLALVTAHRRENHENGLHTITRALWALLERHPDLLVVWPLHPNPKIATAVQHALSGLPVALAERLQLTPAVDYPSLLWLLKESFVVLTDSGGIQEEAVALNVPVLVLRDSTERPEVLESGMGKLVGTKEQAILAAMETLYAGKSRKSAKWNPYGDGHSAQKICDILLKNI